MKIAREISEALIGTRCRQLVVGCCYKIVSRLSVLHLYFVE